jgi:hypothetical protein
MELASAVCPFVVLTPDCSVVMRFCTVANRLWFVLGASAKESPDAGAPVKVTCSPPTVIAWPDVYAAPVVSVVPLVESTTS